MYNNLLMSTISSRKIKGYLPKKKKKRKGSKERKGKERKKWTKHVMCQTNWDYYFTNSHLYIKFSQKEMLDFPILPYRKKQKKIIYEHFYWLLDHKFKKMANIILKDFCQSYLDYQKLFFNQYDHKIFYVWLKVILLWYCWIDFYLNIIGHYNV